MITTQKQFINNIIKGIRTRIIKTIASDRKKAGLTWYKEKELKHLPYNQPNTYALNGKKIHFNNGPEILHSLKEIYIEEIYKTRFSTDAPKIIDCGANVGLSILYFKSKYPSAAIIAFEPDPANFECLKKNIAGNGYSDVVLKNEAIWNSNSSISFINDGTLGSKINTGGEQGNVITVNATRLRDLLNEKIDFLKIDIEGAEYDVILDCKEHLASVQNLFLEFHGTFDKMFQLTEILQIVQQSGFSYYIKEASNVYPTPFYRAPAKRPYDIQLNICCFRQYG